VANSWIVTASHSAVRNLLEYASLKLLCLAIGITNIERKRDQVTVKFLPDAKVDPEQLAKFVSSQRGANFAPDGTLKFTMKAVKPDEVLLQLRAILSDLAGEAAQQTSVAD